jgi:hypothetical protein
MATQWSGGLKKIFYRFKTGKECLMAIFPKTEDSVSRLVMQMVNGLNQHSDLYPSVSEVSKTALMQAYAFYNDAKNSRDTARAAARSATTAKNNAQAALEEQMRKTIHLAEHDCIESPDDLGYIGWGPRKDPNPLAKPGNPSGLRQVYEGAGTITLEWDKAKNGGHPSSFYVERSDQPTGGGIPGPWTLIATSYGTTISLLNQPRGIEMQYRIIATNATGDSMPSLHPARSA